MAGTYIDIHTHNELSDHSGLKSIKNIRITKGVEINPGESLFSVGLHPWDTITPLLEPEVPENILRHPNLIAIGECGIDRLQGGSIPFQTIIFKFLALMAVSLKKPMIIHCVKAWQEIVGLRKEFQPTVPWIIHGFRGKPELARQLVENGFYLSFGEHILHQNKSLEESLKFVPDDRLFLETDDSRLPIEEIYQAAAVIKSLSLIELQSLIEQNFKTVFETHGTS